MQIKASSNRATRTIGKINGRIIANLSLLALALMIGMVPVASQDSRLTSERVLLVQPSNHTVIFADREPVDQHEDAAGGGPTDQEEEEEEEEEDDQPDGDRNETEEEQDDDYDDDGEEFYKPNPLRMRPGELDEPPEPADASKPGKIFDDFDDFEALQLDEFFGEQNRQQNQTRRSVAGGQPRASVKMRRVIKQKAWSPAEQVAPASQSGARMAAASGHSTSGSPGPDACALALESGGCLSFRMVEWALAGARRLLALEGRQADESSAWRPPGERTISSLAELVELAGQLLARRYQLTPAELLHGLEQIDVRRTSLWRQCPRFFRQAGAPCPSGHLLRRYRSHSGRCNNPLAGPLGASRMPFARMLEPAYADGLAWPRRWSQSGGPLPAARLVSLALHSSPPAVGLAELAGELPSDDLSALFAHWGQLVNHDLALAAGAGPATGHPGSCCRARPSRALARVCMPIELAPDDPLYAGRLGCHEFKRSVGALRPGCALGPRSPLNLVSSYLDASFVYGSSPAESRALRRGARGPGQLAVWDYFRARGRLRPLLPGQRARPDHECSARPAGLYCFRSGDARTNQHLPLALLHTLHARQHNRLARGLALVNPHWSSERVYQEARHIHVAQLQHIVLAEYLPLLLGPQTVERLGLAEAPLYWDQYEPTASGAISAEFAAAAFRQGHSSVPGLVFRLAWPGQPPAAPASSRVYQLRELFQRPWALFEPWALDQFLFGLLEAPAKQMDATLSGELAGHLLQPAGRPLGLDLAAINVQRGRDQALADYNSVRHWCGLGRLASFDELRSVMSNQSAARLEALYESVHDIDLFSGGLAEFALPDGQLGPTFACVVGRQFAALRAADRLWFESSAGAHSFTPRQLASIKQFSLARLLCANSDRFDWPQQTIQLQALRLAHPVLNPRLSCGSLADLDLLAWREEPAGQ